MKLFCNFLPIKRTAHSLCRWNAANLMSCCYCKLTENASTVCNFQPCKQITSILYRLMWENLVKADCWPALKAAIQSAMFGHKEHPVHYARQLSFHRVQICHWEQGWSKLPPFVVYWVILLGTRSVGPLPGTIKEALYIPAHPLDTEYFAFVLVSIFPLLGPVYLHALWHSGMW